MKAMPQVATSLDLSDVNRLAVGPPREDSVKATGRAGCVGVYSSILSLRDYPVAASDMLPVITGRNGGMSGPCTLVCCKSKPRLVRHPWQVHLGVLVYLQVLPAAQTIDVIAQLVAREG